MEEQSEVADLRNRIKTVLGEASMVVFLGFGFHPQNVRLLSVADRRDRPLVMATVRNFHSETHGSTRDRIVRQLGVDTRDVTVYDMEAREILSSLGSIIDGRVGE
jgi:hypothetical protein